MAPPDPDLLQELLHAYGPGGQEDEVREICCRELARAALLSLPILSTHDFEVQHEGTVQGCARLLAEYLLRPVA